MSTLASTIIILFGANCISPTAADDSARLTVVSQVPCAVVLPGISANPFKAAQQPNVVSATARPPLRYVYPAKKKQQKPSSKKRKGTKP